MFKRAGQFHDIDEELPSRTPGDVTVHCPACPEPGVNMDESDWIDVPDDKKYSDWFMMQNIFNNTSRS